MQNVSRCCSGVCYLNVAMRRTPVRSSKDAMERNAWLVRALGGESDFAFLPPLLIGCGGRGCRFGQFALDFLRKTHVSSGRHLVGIYSSGMTGAADLVLSRA